MTANALKTRGHTPAQKRKKRKRLENQNAQEFFSIGISMQITVLQGQTSNSEAWHHVLPYQLNQGWVLDGDTQPSAPNGLSVLVYVFRTSFFRANVIFLSKGLISYPATKTWYLWGWVMRKWKRTKIDVPLDGILPILPFASPEHMSSRGFPLNPTRAKTTWTLKLST